MIYVMLYIYIFRPKERKVILKKTTEMFLGKKTNVNI